MTQTGDEDEPIPPKGGYNLDFLDDPNFNPFSTGSAVQLSPPSSPKTSLPPLKAAKTKKQRETAAPAAAEAAAEPAPAETSGVNGSSEPSAAETEQQPAKPAAKKPVRKPVRPGKKLLKKKPPPPAEPQPAADENGRPDSPPLAPAKGYNLDFLDNCDDPNFNPFATQAAVNNSPTGSPQAARKVANSPPPPVRAAANKAPGKPAPPPELEPEPEPVVEPEPVEEPELEPAEEPIVKPEPAEEPIEEPEPVVKPEPESPLQERSDPLAGGDASSSARSNADRTALLDTAPLDFGEVTAASTTGQQMAFASNDQFVEATNFFQDAAALDRLAEHGDGRLAANIARNSLYVKFDPLLGRPSVLPELARLAACAEGPAPAVPRQLTSVKSDLIAFSPGKEPAEPTPAPPPAAPTAAAATAADLISAPPPTYGATDSNVSQLLKKQELYFQDQLLKRDREMTAMKNANAKLIQQAGNNKNEKVLERAVQLVTMLANENGQLRRELKSVVPRLAAERDEARQEVANAEAMFADLHRKYEKSKFVLQEHRSRADRNDAACRESREQAGRELQRYDMLQVHSEDAHARLQADFEASEKSHQTELLTLKAKLQLAENREAKLERENREITAICDELIQKMGGAH